MEYFRYTLQFLNTITFTSSTYTELDNFLNGVVKGYLNHNFGFLPIAPTEDELDELADEIGANYDLMLNDIKPRYEEVLRLGTVHTFRSKDITDSVYGDEERTGKYYEPVVSNAQAQVKTNGELTTWEDDKVTLSREEDRVLSESAIKDFFKEIKEEVELYFIDFVNIYADGTGCQKPYTLEQLQAINSGATKEKIDQIGTNKENIDLLVDAVAGITDALDDKQDKLNATQLDAVNSGINTTKVAQIETNKNNIAQLSNPNLLINGDFRVNQRGQASYTNSTSNATYTVDRWKMVLGNTGLNGTVITPKANGGVNLTCSNAYGGGATPFIQVLENPQNLIGKTLTFSVYISAINSGSCRYRLSNYSTFATGNLAVGLNKITYTVPSGTTQIFCGIICNATTAFDIDIDYMKLEVGSIATPFSPRPYAEELAMCQRYYVRFGGTTDKNIGFGYSNSGGSMVYPQITTPVSMRPFYTISLTTLSCKFYAGGSVVTQSLTGINTSLSEINENLCRIGFTIDGTITASTLWEIRLPANNYLSIDCEIY